MMRKIISTMIRPKVEYVEVTWFPHKKKNVLKLERIQRITTRGTIHQTITRKKKLVGIVVT